MENKEILIGNDVVGNIRKNTQQLQTFISEICDMIGFEHKHPHHHLEKIGIY